MCALLGIGTFFYLSSLDDIHCLRREDWAEISVLGAAHIAQNISASILAQDAFSAISVLQGLVLHVFDPIRAFVF